MVASDIQRAKELASRWGLKVRHALYRKTGNWYHRLTRFPGALLDADGYVIFESEETFEGCPQLQVRKQVSAPKGIKAIPGYVYVSATDRQPDRLLVESIVRGRLPGVGQGWSGKPGSRKAVEAYAMDLAVQHYSGRWPEVIDVSANQPFDLLCRAGDHELRVEVKGTTSQGLSVLLTRNEVAHAQANANQVALFVVSEIKSAGRGPCSGGITQAFEPWDIWRSELDPVVFECWLQPRHNKGLRPTAARRWSKKRGRRRG